MKILSLKKNDDFKTVYNKGHSKVNRNFIIYSLKNDSDFNRLGVSVSKKVGNSVVRHRIKRLVKENVRLSEERLKNGFDIVVIARKGSDLLDYKQTGSSLMHLFGLLHLLRQ